MLCGGTGHRVHKLRDKLHLSFSAAVQEECRLLVGARGYWYKQIAKIVPV